MKILNIKLSGISMLSLIALIFVGCRNENVLVENKKSITLSHEYTISVEKENPRLAKIVAIIEPDGKIVAMNEHNEHGLKNGWATFVENVQAISESGRNLKVVAKKNSSWEIQDYQEGMVTLSYQVRLGHDQVVPKLAAGDNGAAYANDSGVMWAGRALFIAGKTTEDININFDVPKEWHVTTQWGKSKKENSFIVDVTENLLNSAFFAGTHQHAEFNAGGVSLRMAFSGEYTVKVHQQIKQQLQQYFTHYGKLYQSPLNANIVVVVSDASYGGGEMMGNAISLSMGPSMRDVNGLSKGTIHVIAHEVYHSFTNNQLELGEDPPSFVWFKEGFAAEFGTYSAELRVGALNETEFLNTIVKQMKKYQAKLDGKLTLKSAGSEKFKNYNMVYSGGFIAAISLDFLIRHESNGKKRLNDLWVYLLKKHPKNGETLTMPKLYEAVQFLYGERVFAAFDKYISTPDEIPLYKNAALMGLSFDGHILSVSNNATNEQRSLWSNFFKK